MESFFVSHTFRPHRNDARKVASKAIGLTRFSMDHTKEKAKRRERGGEKIQPRRLHEIFGVFFEEELC